MAPPRLLRGGALREAATVLADTAVSELPNGRKILVFFEREQKREGEV
jgi:hypothetical protein